MANKEREFLHNTHMRSSTEMLAIRRKFGNEGYAVYFMLLEQFYNSDECSIELSDINIEIIAGDFLVEEKTLFAMIEYFVAIGLLIRNDNIIEPINKNLMVKTAVKATKKEKNSNKSKELILENIVSDVLKEDFIQNLDANTFFEKFWDIYPVKKGKQKCLDKVKREDFDIETMLKILEAVELQKEERIILQRKKDQGNYTIHIAPWKHPTTWLNQGCWEDEIEFRDRAVAMLQKKNGLYKNEILKEEKIKNPISRQQLDELKAKKRNLLGGI